MYKIYNQIPEVWYRWKMDKKLVKFLLALPEYDPIRIWQDQLLFSYFYKKREVQSDEERKAYFLERIVKVVPWIKDSDELWTKLMAYWDWLYKPVMETLDGNKLLEFLKKHNIDPYLFIYTYGHTLDFWDIIYEWTCKRKGYRKLFNLYREAQRNIFWEHFVNGRPKFEDDED